MFYFNLEFEHIHSPSLLGDLPQCTLALCSLILKEEELIFFSWTSWVERIFFFFLLRSATPLRHILVYGARWDPPKCAKEQVTKQIPTIYHSPAQMRPPSGASHIPKNGWMGNLESYRSLSFTLVPEKVMVQIISSAIPSRVHRTIRGSGTAISDLWPALVSPHLKLC